MRNDAKLAKTNDVSKSGPMRYLSHFSCFSPVNSALRQRYLHWCRILPSQLALHNISPRHSITYNPGLKF